MAKNKSNKKRPLPTFENRRARHDYFIEDTLECGIVLTGSEVKAIREGDASIAEGFITVETEPPSLSMHQTQIGIYPPAGANQHAPKRIRRLLATRREVEKLARAVEQKGITVVPLRMYFKGSLIKVQIGIAKGKAQHDKRRAIAERQTKRELDRAMSKFQR